MFLPVEFLNSVIREIAQYKYEVNIKFWDKNSEGDLDYSTVSGSDYIIGREDIKLIDIEFSLPRIEEFEQELFCDEIVSEYPDLPLTWSYEMGITLKIGEKFPKGESETEDYITDINFLVYDLNSFYDYPDVSSISGYSKRYEEIKEESISDYGMRNFIRGLGDYIKSLYPLADIETLQDCDEETWMKELFYETCEEEYVEDGGLVFKHRYENYEDKIIENCKSKLSIEFGDELDETLELKTINLGEETLYLVMPLKGFNLVQIANIIWLQNENETWSLKNLVFISGCGYYIKDSEYTYEVARVFDRGWIMNKKTLSEIIRKLVTKDNTWWRNWRNVTHYLASIKGLEDFSNHYRHGDKYDLSAKDVFYAFTKNYPDLCSFDNEWRGLDINTSIQPNGFNFIRGFVKFDELDIIFDLKKAVSNQIELLGEEKYLSCIVNFAKYSLKKYEAKGL